MRRVLLIFPAPVAAAAVEIPVFFVFIILRCAFFYFPLSFAVCLFLCAASGSQWQYFQFAKWRIQPTEMPHIVLITYSRVLVAEQSMAEQSGAEQRYERSDSSHDMRYAICVPCGRNHSRHFNNSNASFELWMHVGFASLRFGLVSFGFCGHWNEYEIRARHRLDSIR